MEPVSYLAEHYDSPLRFLVRSQTRGDREPHLVDLGAPSCTCKWWKCEVGPKLKNGLRPSKFCVHYHTAMNAFAPWAVEAFKKADKNKQQ